MALAIGCYQRGEIPSDDGLVSRGAQVYALHCFACHGEADGSNRVAGVPIHGPRGHTWHHRDSQLITLIVNGSQRPEASGDVRMPAWGEILTQEDVRAVLAYIKTWWSDAQHDLRAAWYGCVRHVTPGC